MTFKPSFWYPVTFIASAINLVSGGYAAGLGEPVHAAVHAAFAVAFGLWARHIRLGSRRRELPAEPGSLELEVGRLRQELAETQERLDFAERLLAQRPEVRRMGPER